MIKVIEHLLQVKLFDDKIMSSLPGFLFLYFFLIRPKSAIRHLYVLGHIGEHILKSISTQDNRDTGIWSNKVEKACHCRGVLHTSK